MEFQKIILFVLLQENKTALYWAVEKGNATMVRDILMCNPDTETTTKVKESKTLRHTSHKKLAFTVVAYLNAFIMWNTAGYIRQ